MIMLTNGISERQRKHLEKIAFKKRKQDLI